MYVFKGWWELTWALGSAVVGAVNDVFVAHQDISDPTVASGILLQAVFRGLLGGAFAFASKRGLLGRNTSTSTNTNTNEGNNVG